MEEVMSHPQEGKVIIENIQDIRWKGWNKMQYIKTLGDGQEIIIHYVSKFVGGVLTAVDDFKFK